MNLELHDVLTHDRLNCDWRALPWINILKDCLPATMPSQRIGTLLPKGQHVMVPVLLRFLCSTVAAISLLSVFCPSLFFPSLYCFVSSVSSKSALELFLPKKKKKKNSCMLFLINLKKCHLRQQCFDYVFIIMNQLFS